MYSRHRSNGYRPNSMGMSPGSSTRMPPENSMRGPGFYNPEYRNFNQGPPRPYPLPRKGDIFMDAGRLAAEYLVSKGLLPPNVLPPKWPNAGLRKHPGEFQEYRELEGENMQLPPEGRMSNHPRHANTVSEGGSGKRRLNDEYNQIGSRNSLRDRRRTESFRNHSSDLENDNSMSASGSDKPRISVSKETNEESIYEHHEELESGQETSTGVKNLNPSEVAQRDEDVGSSESFSCQLQSLDDTGSKMTASGLSLETDKEFTKKPDVLKTLNSGIGEVQVCSDKDDTAKPNNSQDTSVHDGELGDYSVINHENNLLSLCQYARVPTRARSSLASRSSKGNLSTIAEGGNTSDSGPPIALEVSVNDYGCLNDGPLSQPSASGGLDFDEQSHIVPSGKDASESGSAFPNEHDKCARSQSFSDLPLTVNEESIQQMATIRRANSMDLMVNDRSEKRAIQHSDREEAAKKPREWFLSMGTEAGDYSNLSSLREKPLLEDRTSPGEDVDMTVDMTVDEANLMDLFPNVVGEESMKDAQEKQLYPNSFKICDLNLMEASDVNENRDRESIIFYPTIAETKKEAASIDIDLSVQNNCNVIMKHNMHSSVGKEVEVIDLDNDSADEDEGFNNTQREKDSVYPDFKNFPKHIEGTSDVPDAQEGYGLMISEMLGNDISNCSSAPADINSVHDGIEGLHNHEEILSDDDVYMSLGEIPISMPEL